jgi:hypothetical protein
MKLFIGWVVAAGLVLAVTGANAQMLAPYQIGSPYMAASDFGGPYAATPPEAPGPRDGPMLLPAREVYTIVRESGFSPLGMPQQRGLIYTIAVIDRGGDDGRLVIDARTGRIIRFMPAHRMRGNFNDELSFSYGPVGPLPPIAHVRGVPRPPLSIPRVASRTPPLPKSAPLASRPAAESSQQSAAAQAKPAEAPTAPPATTGSVAVKPAAPQIAPTQAMPKMHGLD